MVYEVPLTKEHIYKGIQKNCRLCPVALALIAKLKELGIIKLEVIRVDYLEAVYLVGFEYQRIKLCDDVRGILVKFDNTHKMEPCTMILDLENKELRLKEAA